MATVTVKLAAPYEGLQADFRADISARILIDLNSDDLGVKYGAFTKMIVSHNFTDLDGKPTTDLFDVSVKVLDAAATAFANQAVTLPQA
jgi:hypothetical protein